jgi:hypothetical protein
VGNSGFNFFPRSGSWGVSLTRPQYSVRANWNYRGERRGALTSGASIGPDTYTWIPSRVTLDAQAEWVFSRRLAVFGSLRNLTNVTDDQLIYGPQTPGPARFRNRIDYGSLWTFGVRGTF